MRIYGQTHGGMPAWGIAAWYALYVWPHPWTVAVTVWQLELTHCLNELLRRKGVEHNDLPLWAAFDVARAAIHR